MESVIAVDRMGISLPTANRNAFAQIANIGLRSVSWWRRRLKIKGDYLFVAVKTVDFGIGLS